MLKHIKTLATRAFANIHVILIAIMFLCAAVVAADIAIELFSRAI